MRYLVFGGYAYYPDGGWYDWRSGHDSLEAALKDATRVQKNHDWVQVVDLGPPVRIVRVAP